MCVTAVMIQRETGGNLSELLEKVAYTIRRTLSHHGRPENHDSQLALVGMVTLRAAANLSGGLCDDDEPWLYG